jgi:hypothetical protein
MAPTRMTVKRMTVKRTKKRRKRGWWCKKREQATTTTKKRKKRSAEEASHLHQGWCECIARRRLLGFHASRMRRSASEGTQARRGKAAE